MSDLHFVLCIVAYSPSSYTPSTFILKLGGQVMDKEYLIRFGNQIREYRTGLGLSQEKFALKIGMDRTYYASVESGKRNVSVLNIKKIADGLELSVSDLFQNL